MVMSSLGSGPAFYVVGGLEDFKRRVPWGVGCLCRGLTLDGVLLELENILWRLVLVGGRVIQRFVSTLET